ncbi:MAG: NfeD family protein [Sphingomicrobium sp.]
MFGIEPGWVWAIGGVLLLIAEVIAPGFFLLFIGAAATLTGVLTLMFGLGQSTQVALFVVFALLAVMAGRRVYALPGTPNLSPLLNDRASQMVGRTVVVVAPVSSSGGRVKVGDGEWSARGGPAAAGESVLVVGCEGNCLKVEQVPDNWDKFQ